MFIATDADTKGKAKHRSTAIILHMQYNEESGQSKQPGKLAKETEKIPVIEEQVFIGKQEVTTGKVIIAKTIEEQEKELTLTTMREHCEVNRVPAGYYVDDIPDVRYEGDTMIIPVLREEAVVVKKIYLVEELHVTRTKEESTETRKVMVRKENFDVSRQETGNKGK